MNIWCIDRNILRLRNRVQSLACPLMVRRTGTTSFLRLNYRYVIPSSSSKDASWIARLELRRLPLITWPNERASKDLLSWVPPKRCQDQRVTSIWSKHKVLDSDKNINRQDHKPLKVLLVKSIWLLRPMVRGSSPRSSSWAWTYKWINMRTIQQLKNGILKPGL